MDSGGKRHDSGETTLQIPRSQLVAMYEGAERPVVTCPWCGCTMVHDFAEDLYTCPCGAEFRKHQPA